MKTVTKYFITGGAGFIGAHRVNTILDSTDAQVTVYDNFSTGRRWAYGDRINDPRLTIIEADARELDKLTAAMKGHDVVYHFAANSDIASAAKNPDVDFLNGTCLTHNVLEAMRINGVKRIFFTSGSGVYGEIGEKPVPEDYEHMVPISTYGASKLASETLISAYCHMFDMKGTVCRFANVVGPHQTHGVAYDFINRLARQPAELVIYGDGRQSKPYIDVFDILNAFDLLEKEQKEGYNYFNVGSDDHITVTEIADIIVEKMGLKSVAYDYTGGARGWKADVPIYRLETKKIRAMGWANRMNSRQAVEASVEAMLDDLKSGRYK